MEQVPIPHPARQRRLAFAVDDTWERLPEPVQEQSLALLAEALRNIIVREQELRRSRNERQDSV